VAGVVGSICCVEAPWWLEEAMETIRSYKAMIAVR
jgi:hypothetical protein